MITVTQIILDHLRTIILSRKLPVSVVRVFGTGGGLK